MIKREVVRFLLREKLNREFPLGEMTGRDGLKHIAAVEVLISAANLDGLIPNGGLQAELGTPASLISRKLCTPKPSIIRNERGMVLSDMIHITICMDSGVSEMKSQNVSCE